MLKKFLLSLAAFVAIIILLVAGGYLFLKYAPVFGGIPDSQSQQKIAASQNQKGGRFVNLLPTRVMTPHADSPTLTEALSDYFFNPKGKNPEQPLPSEAMQTKPLGDGELIWFGHSTVLFSTEDVVTITDPVFYRASPIPIGGKPFEFKHKTTPEMLPEIDVVLISHDHYDHLDMKSIKELDSKVGQYLVPLGVKAHLQHWGVDSDKVAELDWYESIRVKGVNYTLTPSRHFSGRKLTNGNRTLWGSWAVNSDNLNLYFSGDSGYFDEFKVIGERFGPFDIALLECGAYNRDWSQIHMFPEQTAQAALDLKAERVLPVHWGKFDLSRHTWREPVNRLRKAAEQSNLSVVLPLVGERFRPEQAPHHLWFEEG